MKVDMAGTSKQSDAEIRGKDEALQFARTIPYWLVAIVGLIYASGFLVVTTHLERFGIRVEGVDAWKTRYIHVGVLAMCFPAMIVGTVFGMFHIYGISKREIMAQGGHKDFEPAEWVEVPFRSKRVLAVQRASEKEACHHLRLSMLLSGSVFVLMELAFYAFTMFIRPAAPPQPDAVITRWKLVGMFVFGAGALVIAAHGERERKWEHLWTTAIRLCALMAVVAFSLWAAWPYGNIDVVFGFLQKRSAASVMTTIFLGYIGYALFRLKENKATLSPGRWRAALFISVCIMGPMYYLSLAGFALSVFAYVPAIRDGGDYTVSYRVKITSKREDGAGKQSPNWERLVEETSTTLYVADAPYYAPCHWRTETEPISGLRAISRNEITDIDYKYDQIDCQKENALEDSLRAAPPPAAMQHLNTKPVPSIKP